MVDTIDALLERLNSAKPGDVITTSSKELYYLGLAKAREWNHGRDPEVSARDSFVFNVMNYPESFGLKLTIKVEKVEPSRPAIPRDSINAE